MRPRLALGVSALLAATAPQAGVALNGSWLDPSGSGQGLVIEQLPDNSALMFWHGLNASGQSALMYVDARTTAEGLTGSVYSVSGPRFGEFDPLDLRFEAAGTVTLRAGNDGSAVLIVDTDPLAPSPLPTAPRGTIRRTASLAAQDGSDPESLIRMSGTWAHPQLAGQGVSVQFLDQDNAQVFWHTFDAQGQPRLLYLEANRDGRRLSGTVYAARDGVLPGFAADGNPGSRWGEAQIEFLDCQQASLSYQPGRGRVAREDGAGTLPLLRLTIPQGVRCSDSGSLPTSFGSRLQGQLRSGSQALAADAVITAANEVIVTIADRGSFRAGITSESTPRLLLDGFASSSRVTLDEARGEIAAILQNPTGATLGRLRLQRSPLQVPARPVANWAGRYGDLELAADGSFRADQRSGGILGLQTRSYEGRIELHPDGQTFDASLTLRELRADGEYRQRYLGAGWFDNDGPGGSLRLHQRLRSVDGQSSLSLVWPG